MLFVLVTSNYVNPGQQYRSIAFMFNTFNVYGYLIKC